MPLGDHVVTARLPLPHLVVVGVNTTLSCPLYASGAAIAAVSGTCTVYDEDFEVVATGAVTVVSGLATFVVTGATTTALEPVAGWQVYWSITHAGGTITPRNAAHLVRTDLYPVIGDVDLYRRVPALDPDGEATITSYATHQDFLDEAWTEIERRLIENGRRPWLLLHPGQLRQVHLYLTLGMIFDDLASRLNPAYAITAAEYHGRYETAWGRASLDMDTDDDGDHDEQDQQPAQGSVFLTGRR